MRLQPAGPWLLPCIPLCGICRLALSEDTSHVVAEPEDAASLLQAVKTGSFRDGDLKQRYSIDMLDPSKCNIFTLWEKENAHTDMPLFQRLALETWRRHTRSICNDPFLISDDNVRDVIPDLPEEYFRLPYAAAKSDFLRYAALYHHGGIFIDFDMVAVGDVSDIVDKAQRLDLLSHSPLSSSCFDFSSNLLGGRKGSPFHKAVWEQQKAAITSNCEPWKRTRERVCCFESKMESCHVPWGGLGEHISHKVFMQLRPDSAFCYAADQSFSPTYFAVALEQRKLLKDAKTAFAQMQVKGALDRKVYHMFNALNHWQRWSCHDLFNSNFLVGHLFTKAFASSLSNQTDNSGAGRAFLKEHPEFKEVSSNHAAPDGRLLPCIVQRIG